MPIVSPAAEARTTSPAQDDNLTREWCTAAEVAAIARMSERRVHAAVRTGALRAAVIDARGTIRVHRAWVTNWLERLADASDMSSGGRSATVRDFTVISAGDRNGNGNGVAE